MLAIGDRAPGFELLDQRATPRSLAQLLATGPVALFFYPAALSYGCTRESCTFRDLAGEFAALGARPVGITRGAVELQQRFDNENGLNMALLSDGGGEVARAYGVERRLAPRFVRRATFVIGTDFVIRGVVRSETRMGRHASEALEVLRALA